MAARNNGCRDAIPPSAFDQHKYARFAVLEPVALAFAGFENECFEVAKVIVDDCVDLAAERRMVPFAGTTRAAGLRRVARRMAWVPRMSRVTGIAGQTGHAIAERRGQDVSRIAAEAGDSAADDL